MNEPAISSFESGKATTLPAITSQVSAIELGSKTQPTDAFLNVQLKQVKTKVTKRIKKEEGRSDKEIWDVRVGSASLTIYFTPSGERELFTVSYWVDRKRTRQVFPSLDKAIEEAKVIGKQLAKGDFGTVELSASDRVAAARAIIITD